MGAAGFGVFRACGDLEREHFKWCTGETCSSLEDRMATSWDSWIAKDSYSKYKLNGTYDIWVTLLYNRLTPHSGH